MFSFPAEMHIENKSDLDGEFVILFILCNGLIKDYCLEIILI